MKLKALDGRVITYLRLSVTDRCNLRCRYCMPPEGVEPLAHCDVLSYEETIRAVKAMAQMGVSKIRVTGGEPLVRKDVVSLVAGIKNIPGIREVALTTNGLLLDKYSKPLKEAGLDRLNISLDTLSATRFHALTGGGSLSKFWRGVKAAQAAGFTNLKFNCVVMKGFNDDELGAFTLLAQENPWQVRFIEYMPMGGQRDAWQVGYMPYQEIESQAIKQLSTLTQVSQSDIINRWTPMGISGTARVVKPGGFMGSVGFISPIGEHFCHMCNRLRLSSDGLLHACLLEEGSVNLRELLRSGCDDDTLKRQIAIAAGLKPSTHSVGDSASQATKNMSKVGG